MKNILKKFLIILIAFLLIISINIISKADNETTTDVEEDIVLDETDIISDEDNEDESSVYDYQENFFKITSQDITIDDVVDGDVFIMSSGSVTINTTIAGNIFVCASSVEISSNAQIYASLFSVSESLTISGIVYGNVYSVAQDFTLDNLGYIGTDLFLIGQNTNINGYIYRDANIYANQITISEDAFIADDLYYSAENEITIPDDVVNGTVTFDLISGEEDNSSIITSWLYSAVTYIVLAIVIFVICKWLHCKFINESSNFGKNISHIILYGLLGTFITPIVCIMLMMLGVTITLSFVLMLIYFIFAITASAIFIVTLSELCSRKTKDKIKTNDTLRTTCFIIIFGAIYKLLQEIPTLGSILTFIAVIMGFGILIKYIIPEKTQSENASTE